MLSETAPPWSDLARLHEMMQRPRFADAMRRSVEGAFATYAEHPAMGRAHRDMDRYLGGIFALYLHTTEGLTPGRFEALVKGLQFASRGHAGAILDELRRTGYLVPAPATADRRVKRLVPSAPMIAAYRKGLGNDLKATLLLEPALADFAGRFEEDDDVFFAFIAALGNALRPANAFYASDALKLNLFLRYTGGLMILCALLLGGDPADTMPPRAAVHCSVSALAQRFNVGRAQVRKILASAERDQLLTRDPDANTARFTPEMIQLLDFFFAVLFTLIAEAARATER